MPETQGVRNKILEYKEKNGLSYRNLGTLTGTTKEEVQMALTGKRDTPKSNRIITVLVKQFNL